MLKVGFIGWRGMVGSVLIKRMREEKDFVKIKPIFFSTSNSGAKPPELGINLPKLQDAYDIKLLANLDCIVTTQGNEYTKKVLPELRASGWDGYWIDASSCLRMNDDSLIVLDPINRDSINVALRNGVKNFSGGNCTVSLMLLALDGLFKADLIEWVSSMTYQAASGAGANNMRELLKQQGVIYNSVNDLLDNSNSDILQIDGIIKQVMDSSALPKDHFGAPLAGNVLPWIDVQMPNGQTKEEWKTAAEANKILSKPADSIKIDGLCVRVGALRSHSQGLTIKLKNDNLAINEIEQIIANANPWIKIVANNKESVLAKLNPVAVSGTLDIAVGRIRHLMFGRNYITLFTVGDQLLWGAAEPLRRMLNILVESNA